MRCDRGMFYWVLARHRLPAMWRYFSACVYAEKTRGDDILDLGAGVLIRAIRGLQARDAIGEWFYAEPGRRDDDQMLYDFEYLTLALAGALDAQARVAHRACGLSWSERSTSFSNDRFLRALATEMPALHAVVTAQHFRDLGTLLRELRNTVHGAALRALTTRRGLSEESHIQVPEPMASRLWDAASRQGGPDGWGVVMEHHRVQVNGNPQVQEYDELRLGPFTYASRLVTACLSTIDDVARATNVERLLPAHSAYRLSEGPPEGDGVFDRWIRERFALLG